MISFVLSIFFCNAKLQKVLRSTDKLFKSWNYGFCLEIHELCTIQRKLQRCYKMVVTFCFLFLYSYP